jgi:hypothetical protein
MLRHPWPLALTFVLCGAAAGCGDEPPPRERSVVLGTGQADFEPMDGEPELSLVAGIQGGFHVWASFLAYGYSAQLIGMVLVTTVDGEPDSRLVMRANLSTYDTIDADGNTARSFAGFPAQVYDARCAHGRRVEVNITLTDSDGTTSEDTRYCIANVAPALRLTDCD